jgi:hypothetical protein
MRFESGRGQKKNKKQKTKNKKTFCNLESLFKFFFFLLIFHNSLGLTLRIRELVNTCKSLLYTN